MSVVDLLQLSLGIDAEETNGKPGRASS